MSGSAFCLGLKGEKEGEGEEEENQQRERHSKWGITSQTCIDLCSYTVFGEKR